MAHLQQIATYLMKTTQGNTQTIRQAEKQLQKESRNQQFLNNLLSIPMIEGASPQLIKIATIYTLTYARNLVIWKNQALINIAAEKLVQFLANNKIQFKYKDQVGAALQYLILKDHNNIITNAYMLNIISLLQKSLQSPANQVDYQFITIICQTMSEKSVPAAGPNSQLYIKESFLALSIFVKRLLELGISHMATDETIIQKVLLLAAKMLKIMKKKIKRFMYFSVNLTQILYTNQFYEMITYVLKFNLPQNQIQVPLFYVNSKCNAKKIIELFHVIKSIIIYLLSQSLRIIINSNQKLLKNKLQQSLILNQCPELIGAFVKSVDNFLQKIPYSNIKSKVIFKIIQQIFNFLILALRSCRFYNALNDVRHTLIYSCIFKTLALTYGDYQNYYHDADEFVNSMFHIIEINVGFLLANDNPEAEESQIDVQIFDTIKTNAANLLKTYVKYIDGSLAQILYYITNVLQGEINIQYSKILIMFILSILRDEVKIRGDFMGKIKKIIFINLEQLQIPTKKVEEPFNVQYSMNLLIVSRYLVLFHEVTDNINTLQKVYTILQTLLKNPSVQDVPKIIAGDILSTFLKIQEGSLYCRRIMTLFSEVMSAKNISIKHLQCIQNILKQNDFIFKDDYLVLINTVQKISAFLKTQLKKSQKNQQVIVKLWHIFQQIIISKEIGPLMADTMRRVLQPFVNMINGQNQLELQQKVYNLIEKLIKSTGVVGQFQIQILGILPKTFFVGKNKKKFSTSFSLLQLIILHGSQILSSDVVVTQNLILLCIENINATTVNSEPRTQSDFLEGVLILQSLIISIGNKFSKQIWETITKCLVYKVQNTTIVYDFVKESIVSTLCVIVAGACNLFSLTDNEQILKVIFKQFHYLNHIYPSKLFVIAASNLLKNYNEPFLSRFSQILDCTVTLLKNSVSSKSIKVSQMDDEINQYNKISSMVVTCYSNIDEFQYFKLIIQEIKQSNLALFESGYNSLPEIKKQYLKDLMHIRKVNDQPRIIHRIKNKQKQMQM